MLGVSQCIAPLNVRIFDAVNKHIHTSHRQSGAVSFLAVHLHLIKATLTSCSNQERTGSTRGVVYTVIFLGSNDLRHNFGYLLRSKEASCLFTRHRSKFANHVLICITNNIGRDLTFFRCNIARSEIEIREVIEQITENRVLLFLLTKVAFAVEVDSSENTIKNCIGAFNSSQGFTDLITEIGSILIFQEVIKGIFVFECKRKILNLSFQTDTFIFLFKVINAFGISIAKILDEKHGKDIIFVIGGVNVISESICSRPQSSFNIIKRGLSHYVFLQRFLRIF